MTVADYFINFFIENGVTDVFGYQGGMIAYLFDSMGRNPKIAYHHCSTEQGAALAACGFSQATGKPCVALSTSGPGFTNLITGIADAWYDSLPILFISGQVNTKDKRRNLPIRQLGFQEIPTTKVIEEITKGAFEIDDDTDIKQCLIDAWTCMKEGRPGPAFIDLPINICRNIVDDEVVALKESARKEPEHWDIVRCFDLLKKAHKPVIVAGAGINQACCRDDFAVLVETLKIPVITTLPGVDLLPTDSIYRIGYQGGTARREAGVVLATADFILTIGTRLCAKSTGYHFPLYAPHATMCRVDIDSYEFERKLKDDEFEISADAGLFIKEFIKEAKGNVPDFTEWVEQCDIMKKELADCDITFGNEVVRAVTKLIPNNMNITLDVGNNMIYGAQSSIIKENTRLFVSGGLGAMGYSLPAAIGTTIGNHQKTCVITGDGGIQMNIQELNLISQRKMPIKIVVLNNNSLGHILLFQKAYLDQRYCATDAQFGDYYSCDFAKIAEAYGIRSHKVTSIEELVSFKEEFEDDLPLLVELEYVDCSMLPNIHGGCDCLTSGPVIPSAKIDKILSLGFKILEE